MSNHLKMAIVQAILHLRSLRWSQRRIAKELEIDRRTVQRHLRECGKGQKPPFRPPAPRAQMPPLFPGCRLPGARRQVMLGVAIMRPIQKPPFRPPAPRPLGRVAQTPRRRPT